MINYIGLLIFTLFTCSLSINQWPNFYDTATPSTAPTTTTTTSTSTFSSSNSFCPIKENCRFYQVNLNFTDYGCSVCNNKFMLVANERGIGECRMKNTIKNCKGAVSRPDWIEGDPVCFECNEGFVLRNDSYTCYPIPQDQKIKDCQNYYQNNTEVYCNVCNEGFSLAESRKSCEPGCRLTGCESCQILNGRFYCFNCEPGYIGTLDPEAFLYKKCLSCDDLQYNLKQINSTYRPPR